MLELQVGNTKKNKHNHEPLVIRKVDFNTINDFKGKLSNELWQDVFDYNNNDANNILNFFLNVYLHIFYSCFPKKQLTEQH